MEKVKVFICKEKDGSYSMYVDEHAKLNYGLIGEGSSVQQAMNEWRSMYNAMKKSYEEKGLEFVEAEFEFVFDVPSFLQYYSGLVTFRGLAKLTGISAAQLSQYVSGYRTPSPKTTQKIQAALHAFGNELSQLQLV